MDHTVSHEEFEIWQCNLCSLRFTQAAPGKEDIAGYYESADYISHSDTNKGIINSLYHTVRKKTLLSKRKLVEKYSKITNGKILDVGSGTGAFVKTMKDAGWKAEGIEPDDAARQKAKQLYHLQLHGPEMLFILPPASLNAITLWHVLEHVHDLHEYIEQFKRLLQPGSLLFVAVPNYTSYDESIYKSFWAAYDVPRHLYHFSPEAMTALLVQHKLKLKTVEPMYWDSFYVSMLSERYKYGENRLITACWNGLISNFRALKDHKRCSSLIYIAENQGL